MSEHSQTNTTSYYSSAYAYDNNWISQIIAEISVYWQLVIAFPAIVMNLVVFITYLRVKSLLPPSARVILTNQSFLELCCAAFSIIWQHTKDIKPYLPDGVYADIICNIWVDFYWCAVYAVELNCITFAADRFCAVCLPMKRIYTARRALISVLTVDTFACIAVIVQDGVVTRFDRASGYCVQTSASRTFLMITGVIQLTLFPMAPLIAIIIFYPPMIYTIVYSGRKLINSGSSDRTRNAATNRLVRTVFIAAVVLLIANTPDMVFYYFYYCIFGIENSSFGSYQQAIITMFTVLYPLLSPLIYSFSTPKFREAAISAFSCKASLSKL